jgi:hypothetical protein
MRQFTFLSFIIAHSVFSLASGCSGELAADTEKMVFYCTETREIVVADRQPFTRIPVARHFNRRCTARPAASGRQRRP